MVFTLTLPPLLPLRMLPHPKTRKATDRKAINKKGKKGQTPPKAKTGTPNTSLPRTSLSRPSKLHFYCHFHGWVTTHGWPSSNGGHHGDACQFMKSRPSELFHPSHAISFPYPRCRTQLPRLHQCPACRQCASLPLCPVHSPTWSRLSLTVPYYYATPSRSNQASPQTPGLTLRPSPQP